MKILLIGGGVFLGAAVVDAALAGGHELTAFNRGRARSAWPDGVEVLAGDRTADLSALAGRRFDAVIDCCGYVPADVRRSAEALRESSRYLFVSSISAYASLAAAGTDEAAALAPAAGIADDDRDLQHYGPQKAACEAEVTAVFGDRALLVRPGLIVGPGDRTGRFSHWPWRMAEGGTLLAPAAPADAPLQCIDVRDLAGWMVALVQQGAQGPFNATGPVDGPPLTWPVLLQTCADAVAQRGGTPAQVVSVAEDFLLAQGVAPWSELPLWLPSTDLESAGLPRVALDRARATGLRTRPLGETIDAVLAEGVPAPDDQRRAGKLGAAREAELIAAWRQACGNRTSPR